MLTPHKVKKEEEIRNFYFFSITVSCLRIELKINGSAIFSNRPRLCQTRVIPIRIRMRMNQTDHIVIEKITTKSTVGIRANRSKGTGEISHKNFPCSSFYCIRGSKLCSSPPSCQFKSRGRASIGKSKSSPDAFDKIPKHPPNNEPAKGGLLPLHR